MRAMVNLVAGLLVVAVLAACGTGGEKEAPGAATGTPAATGAEATPRATPSPTPTPEVSFTNENWGLALSNADKYKDAPVVLTGKVFTEPEISEGTVCFQMWTDPENREGNTGVCGADGSKGVTSDSYVRVTGTVVGELSGENVFGQTVRIPGVAGVVEKVTRSEVVAPAIVVIDVGSEQTQHGLTIRLDKIEIAETETRVWVTITNASVNKASAYEHGAFLVQGTLQYETEYVYGSDLPEIDSTILSGVETTGVLMFEAIEPAAGQVRLLWDGPRTDDYRLDFHDWIWDVTW